MSSILARLNYPIDGYNIVKLDKQHTKMVRTNYASTLATLRAQQEAQPLSILALAEPITSSQAQAQCDQSHPLQVADTPSSTSAVAAADSSLLTPTALAADLAHYKDLFSKLRFSYLEQVTKEKYLRSIVGDPPLVVSHEDNLALEGRLGAMKTELKAKKDEVDALVAQMEGRASEVATAYDAVNAAMETLQRVPAELDALREEVEALQDEIARRRRDEDGEEGGGGEGDKDRNGWRNDPRMHLPLAETEAEVAAERARTADVDRQIEALQRAMPAKVREVEKIDRELGELENRRNESVRLAVEMRRRREESGGRDEVEELGRWYRASEGVLRGLLDVQS